jgi:hypothetical protein
MLLGALLGETPDTSRPAFLHQKVLDTRQRSTPRERFMRPAIDVCVSVGRSVMAFRVPAHWHTSACITHVYAHVHVQVHVHTPLVFVLRIPLPLRARPLRWGGDDLVPLRADGDGAADGAGRGRQTGWERG